MAKRNDERKHLDEPTRLILLENDVDWLDNEVRQLREEVRKTNRILVGVLISVVVGIVVYAGQILLDALRNVGG